MKHLLAIALLSLTLVGCNQQEDNRIQSQGTNIDFTKVTNKDAPVSQSIATQAKKTILENEEVTAVRGINTSEKVLLAFKVKQFDSFRETKLEDELKNKLEKAFPEKKIFVSSDEKIFIELDQLEKEIQNKDMNEDELKKDFKTIQDLLNDEA
ncbi:YhcN/YlaJ family sporulation lipoprotein [Radiobacillus kanasensis]|uniref:YhcN/YlaJ family sporulation lipoprotein n=1 Tax=Radiobacillus kanasensis TaxID=2844358 RepID=UPI001E4964FA|nr:YhcN/YlaJ family sporulation lipoprotein [Radiobacillus kanasensis]UFU00850.1 YhcN/YlaJ family sporulation lipoprotein [Radiobacillus kanasensis]